MLVPKHQWYISARVQLEHGEYPLLIVWAGIVGKVFEAMRWTRSIAPVRVNLQTNLIREYLRERRQPFGVDFGPEGLETHVREQRQMADSTRRAPQRLPTAQRGGHGRAVW